MNARSFRGACLSCGLLSMFLPGIAQYRVDPRNMYERLYVVVPITGKGTKQDPKRPLYAPVPEQMKPASRTGIIAFQFQPSDDGKFALAEFVAVDRTAFKTILADPTLRAFQKGKDKREAIEAEFKKYKKDFDFNHFIPVRVQ